MSDTPQQNRDPAYTECIGVQQTYGLSYIDAILGDPSNVVLPIDQCTLTGFVQKDDEYRANSAVLGEGFRDGMIRADVLVEGTYYPGFVFYDMPGTEVIRIHVDGEQKGVAVADFDDNTQHLFFLTEPVDFTRNGNSLELRVSHVPEEGGSKCRTEVLILMAERPELREPVYAIENVGLHENETGAWTLTWTTTQRARCAIVFGHHSEPEEKPLAFNNHRLALPGLRPGVRRRFRIRADFLGGARVVSDWLEYPPRSAPPHRSWKPRTGKLRLHVQVGENSKYSDWPVTGGVPFPRGHLASPKHVRLVRTGRLVEKAEQPMQAKVTAKWPDGSIKWLLVDFRHSGPSAEYVLQYGPKIGRKPLAPKPFATIPSPFGHITLKDAGGTEFRANLVPGHHHREEEDLLRRCFRAVGSLQDTGLAYEVCIHAYAGTPWVRILFTFGINADAGPGFSSIQSLSWELPFVCQGEHRVYQHTDDHYESFPGGNGMRWEGAIGPVWVRDFWQNYPKDLELENGTATLQLLPPLKTDEVERWLARHSTITDEVECLRKRLFFWVDPKHAPGAAQLTYKLRRGMTKTHEVWVGLDGRPPQSDRPLFAACDPEWYAASGAFGPITLADTNRPVVRDYDAQVASIFQAYLKRREEYREYGMFNFGDWWGEGRNNWGNLEYDTAHGLFLQFIRSGEERFFRAAEEAAVHGHDIDSLHDRDQLSRDGQVYPHCIGHVGSACAAADVPNGMCTALGSCNVDHTWAQGYFDHYFLTGDQRSLDTALNIADHYASYGTWNYDFTNCRMPGWHLTLCMAAYRATNDSFYLNACRIIVDRVLERQTMEPELGTAGGGWRRRLVPRHCECTPRHHGNSAFMVGILLTGLRWYHMETGDPSIPESIHRAARFLIDDMWEEDVTTFRYSSCPEQGKSKRLAFQNFLMFDGMAYALQLHPNDREIAAVLATGTGMAIHQMDVIMEDDRRKELGKNFSMSICVAPHCLGALADLVPQVP